MNRYVCIHGHFYQPPRDRLRTALEVVDMLFFKVELFRVQNAVYHLLYGPTTRDVDMASETCRTKLEDTACKLSIRVDNT